LRTEVHTLRTEPVLLAKPRTFRTRPVDPSAMVSCGGPEDVMVQVWVRVEGEAQGQIWTGVPEGGGVVGEVGGGEARERRGRRWRRVVVVRVCRIFSEGCVGRKGKKRKSGPDVQKEARTSVCVEVGGKGVASGEWLSSEDP
jgi:hypothetical protein